MTTQDQPAPTAPLPVPSLVMQRAAGGRYRDIFVVHVAAPARWNHSACGMWIPRALPYDGSHHVHCCKVCFFEYAATLPSLAAVLAAAEVE